LNRPTPIASMYVCVTVCVCVIGYHVNLYVTSDSHSWQCVCMCVCLCKCVKHRRSDGVHGGLAVGKRKSSKCMQLLRS